MADDELPGGDDEMPDVPSHGGDRTKIVFVGGGELTVAAAERDVHEHLFGDKPRELVSFNDEDGNLVNVAAERVAYTEPLPPPPDPIVEVF